MDKNQICQTYHICMMWFVCIPYLVMCGGAHLLSIYLKASLVSLQVYWFGSIL